MRIVGNNDLETFAAQRGLPVAFLEQHGLHICPDDGERPGWIAIPYPNLTGVWYNRYRSPNPDEPMKYWARPGSVTHLYNPSRLGPNAETVFFTEGELDCLVLTYLGFPAIGLPGTGTTARFQGNATWRLLFDDTAIVVAFDGDEAGRTAEAKMLDLFSPRAFSLGVPDGLDVNGWFLSDAEGLRVAASAFMGEQT